MIKGSSLRECILHQASQTTTNVEHALHDHIHRSQKAYQLLHKRLIAVEQECQQCQDLTVWVQKTKDEVMLPLKARKPQQQSRVGAGFQGTVEEQHALVGSPRSTNRADVGDAAGQALQKESLQVGACLKFIQDSMNALNTTISDCNDISTKMRNQCDWLLHSIRRDNDCITSAPSRPYQTKIYGNAGLLGESSNSNNIGAPTPPSSLGSSREYSNATPMSSLTSPMKNGKARKTVTLSAEAAAALQPLGWEDEVDETYQTAGKLVEDSIDQRAEIITKLRKATLDCSNQRKDVLDKFNKCINNKLRERQNWVAEIESIEKKMIDVKRQWRGTSEAAIQMKKPIDVADERQRMRNETSDHVGNALVTERAALRQGRHELKKLCKAFSQQMKAMKDRLKDLRHKIAVGDDEMAIDRMWMTKDNPMSTGMVPGVARHQSKRTYNEFPVAGVSNVTFAAGNNNGSRSGTGSGGSGPRPVDNAALLHWSEDSGSNLSKRSASVSSSASSSRREPKAVSKALGSLAVLPNPYTHTAHDELGRIKEQRDKFSRFHPPSPRRPEGYDIITNNDNGDRVELGSYLSSAGSSTIASTAALYCTNSDAGSSCGGSTLSIVRKTKGSSTPRGGSSSSSHQPQTARIPKPPPKKNW